jgi:hypothetical protein
MYTAPRLHKSFKFLITERVLVNYDVSLKGLITRNTILIWLEAVDPLQHENRVLCQEQFLRLLNLQLPTTQAL